MATHQRSTVSLVADWAVDERKIEAGIKSNIDLTLAEEKIGKTKRGKRSRPEERRDVGEKKVEIVAVVVVVVVQF